jgi:catechol 2,3-dioxygenase-like lactoylglutathione lyase family enzyme
MNDSYVELHVPDFDIAKDFYCKLGFEVVWEKRPSDKLRAWYLVMKRESCFVCFWPGNQEVENQTYFKNFPANTKKGYGVEIIFPVSDIDGLYELAKTFANIVGELKVRHFGKKDFRLEDPFGYYLRFTEPYDILDLDKKS